MSDDTTRAVLGLLSEGADVRDILRTHPTLTTLDVQHAAAEALAMLEGGETREQRIARVRETHARAFEPWDETEERALLGRFHEGAPLAAIARELQRPPGAVRARLERKLGKEWRDARSRSG